MTSQVAAEDSRTRAIDASFDLHDPTLGQYVYAVLDSSREIDTVSRSEQYGGYWVITGYEEVRAAAHDPELFSNRRGVLFPSLIDTEAMIPVSLDPPDHVPYRRILAPMFAPAAVDRRAGAIRDIANYLIDQFIERGEVDFSQDLGVPLAAIVTLRLLGMDATQWPRYAEIAHATHKHGWIPNLPPEQRDPLFAEVAESYMWVFARMSDRINEVRENPVGESLIDQLVRAEIDGEPLPHDVMTHILHTVYDAGMDTTASAVSAMALRLSDDPQLRAELVAEPDKIPAFVDESLRIQSPAVMLRREVTRDCRFAGHDMKAGDAVLLAWAGANRDPAAFADPTTFDLGRSANHVAFGLGVHRCLGSHIARLELRIVIAELLRRIPDFTVDGDRLTTSGTCGVVFGFHEVPATFAPGPKLNAAPEADVLNGGW